MYHCIFLLCSSFRRVRWSVCRSLTCSKSSSPRRHGCSCLFCVERHTVQCIRIQPVLLNKVDIRWFIIISHMLVFIIMMSSTYSKCFLLLWLLIDTCAFQVWWAQRRRAQGGRVWRWTYVTCSQFIWTEHTVTSRASNSVPTCLLKTSSPVTCCLTLVHFDFVPFTFADCEL